MRKWKNGEVVKLSKFAETESQVSYAAFSFGLKHRWRYFIADIEDLLEPLEQICLYHP